MLDKTHTISAGIPRLGTVLAAASLLLLPAVAAAQNAYVQTNMVSDIPGRAKVLDPNLVNPWGIALSATSPFWIANNHSGTSTLYNGSGEPFPVGHPLVVTIPPPAMGTPPAAPTGVVFNSTGGFMLGMGKPAVFIFATEDGTISGWNPNVDPTNAIRKSDKSGSAIYKGLAIASTHSGPMLYATNFFAGTVDVFDTNFMPTTVPGGFVDPNIPMGYAPFGIRLFGDMLYITYALQDDAKTDDVAGPGHGFIDIFDLNGHLQKRFISGGALNSPWGMAWAPPHFGAFSGDLLVGNFGNGMINAYKPDTGEWLGALKEPSGSFNAVKGLWALQFGNDANGGDSNVLYFTAGIPGPNGAVEDHGLFGAFRVAMPH